MTRGMEQSTEAAAPPCSAGDAACRMDRMQNRQGMMSERMDLMQMMMRHMMGRMGTQTPSPVPSPGPENEAENHAEHH
jgi:hypothetical protein